MGPIHSVVVKVPIQTCGGWRDGWPCTWSWRGLEAFRSLQHRRRTTALVPGHLCAATPPHYPFPQTTSSEQWTEAVSWVAVAELPGQNSVTEVASSFGR